MQLDEERDAEGHVRRQGQDYYLKPMNCPMHNLVFRSRGRSYRELPLRLFEFGTVYRYEKSGVIHGLTRARGFTQDDAHIYCTPEQMPGELRGLLDFVLGLLADYGLSDFHLELSTRDPEKSVGTDESWEVATEALRQAALDSGLELVPDPGGAAFYAPKISVQARDAIGRTWQMSTIQVDLMLPERFDLEYTAADGSRQRPVMIHRACSARWSASSASSPSTTPARSPRGWRRCRCRHPGHRRAGRLPARRRAAAARPRHPGGGRRLRRPDAEEDPHRQQAEGALRADRRGHRRRGRRGLLPLPRRQPAQRRPRRAAVAAIAEWVAAGRHRPTAEVLGRA
jgi:hypothetical protein